MLDKQIQILNVDTGNFYSSKEKHLHWKNNQFRKERNYLKNKLEMNKDLTEEQREKIAKLIEKKKEGAKKTKEELLALLENKVKANEQSDGKAYIRTLKENELTDNNIISVFESSFTRMIGTKTDELCEDFMVVQVFYFDVIKDLIYHGFMYKGEKYIYFTSSAGQIRTKKCVFIKESVWKKYEKTIMCGLTLDKINEKGGNNPNKHLAYLALINSATDEWKEFDIDKCIVVEDFETNIIGDYDYVDGETYDITITKGEVLIPHTDGCGIMLPNAFGSKQVNTMVRLPWVKGLLGVFAFDKFIEYNGCSPVIKDIYGKEHDVLKEDIQVIFTKSQFKLWKYYNSFDEYKEYFKKYNCQAGITNPERERIKDATINYQMLQTLTNVTEEDIMDIARPSIDEMNELCSSIDNLKKILGINPYNINKTWTQKCIELYPDLIGDGYFKESIKQAKDSKLKRYRAGSLKVNGKYTFILPDLYAFCEWLFMGIEQPKGLLDNKEIFCWLFRKSEEVDVLRSPHLFKEHAIRKNIAFNGSERQLEIREWFETNAIYTSTHDMISKILMFDRP